MKNFNTFILVALVALGSMINSSCTNEEVIDNSSVEKPMHHLGLYSMSKDLLEIYDANVVAVCDGQVLRTINLKNTPAYAEDNQTRSYDIDVYTTASSVEYKLQLSCCKAEDDLELFRDYELSLDARFVSVASAPEEIFKMMQNTTQFIPQPLNGMTLQSTYNAGSEYNGQTVYEVYALLNSKSFVLGAY